MRSLTVVKDELGNVKVAQFGSIVGEDVEESQLVEDACLLFKTFVSEAANISGLSQKIKQISFFQPAEYTKFFFSLIRQPTTSKLSYYNTFLDAEIGVKILERYLRFNSKTRLVSYYNYTRDIMFAPLYFEINYSTGQSLIRYQGNTIFQLKIGEPSTSAKGELIKSRGRKKQTEEEKLHKQLQRAQRRTGKK